MGVCVKGVDHTIVGDVTEVVMVDVVPRKQEHALETREAGKEATPVGKRSPSSVRPSGYTDRVMVDVDVTILEEDAMFESGQQIGQEVWNHSHWRRRNSSCGNSHFCGGIEEDQRRAQAGSLRRLGAQCSKDVIGVAWSLPLLFLHKGIHADRDMECKEIKA